MEGRHQCARLPTRRAHFNSRPSARGDWRTLHRTAYATPFQFTPLREGRHDLGFVQHHAACISIHAPPRGATPHLFALARERAFQFTPLREGRLGTGELRALQRISIHAPPRGATGMGRSAATTCYFNSRPSARGDPHSGFHAETIAKFQFTPLREGRPTCQQTHHSKKISIHAPPRGATCAVKAACTSAAFQFTPLREGRLVLRAHPDEKPAFQFTPLREGRRGQSREFRNRSHFNSRPSARGDDLSTRVPSSYS